MPATRAASARETPSRIIAIASSRRAWSTPSLRVAKPRSAPAVCSVRIMATGWPIGCSLMADRCVKGSESQQRHSAYLRMVSRGQRPLAIGRYLEHPQACRPAEPPLGIALRLARLLAMMGAAHDGEAL